MNHRTHDDEGAQCDENEHEDHDEDDLEAPFLCLRLLDALLAFLAISGDDLVFGRDGRFGFYFLFRGALQFWHERILNPMRRRKRGKDVPAPGSRYSFD